jgi:hypothetical protein
MPPMIHPLVDPQTTNVIEENKVLTSFVLDDVVASLWRQAEA